MKLASDTDVGLANRVVSMSFACKAIGMKDTDYAASGAKVDCPFATLFHPGGGKSFRLYEDKSAYCFACGQHYSPCELYSIAKDISLEDAATELLLAFGYTKPTAEVRYQEASSESASVDQSSLAEALKVWCLRNFPLWEVNQFDDDVAHKFRQCVDLLPSVHSTEDSRKWLEAAKKAMTKVLGEHQS